MTLAPDPHVAKAALVFEASNGERYVYGVGAPAIELTRRFCSDHLSVEGVPTAPDLSLLIRAEPEVKTVGDLTIEMIGRVRIRVTSASSRRGESGVYEGMLRSINTDPPDIGPRPSGYRPIRLKLGGATFLAVGTDKAEVIEE